MYSEPIDSARVNLDLYRALAPLLREFLAWRATRPPAPAAKLVHCDIAGYTRAERQRAETDVELLGSGHQQLREVAAYMMAGHKRWIGMLVTVPVGAYGERWAANLVQTAHALAEDWASFCRERPLGEQVRDHSIDFDLLLAATFNGGLVYRNSHERDVESSARRTLYEGLWSPIHALALLTMDTVPGYEETPDRLAAAIVSRRLLDRMALLLPLNVLGPMCASGQAFPSPVLAAVAGGVDFEASRSFCWNSGACTAVRSLRAPMSRACCRDVQVRDTGVPSDRGMVRRRA